MTGSWFADERLSQLALEHPHAPGVLDASGVLTWAELDNRASAAAAIAVIEGAEPRDRIAVIAAPTGDTIAAILGVLRIGAIAAPLPVGQTPRELAALSRAVDPMLVLHAVDLSGRLVPVPSFPEGRDPEDPALVVLTSGTTGAPRGAVLSHRAMARSAESWLAVLPPATGWALPLGLSHVAGLGVVWRALRDGVPVRIVARDDPAALLRAFEADPAPSHVSLVPTQLARVLDVASAAPPATLHAVLLGGGPIPPGLVTRALRAGWPVVPTYGLTETASGATALATEDAWDHPASAGRSLPGVDLSIADADGDGVGEIVVRTTARFSGYLGDDGEPVQPDAPVMTGDLGRIDEAGRLYVVSRRLDRIVRGGENVAPVEVEAVLQEHPAVAEACVVGRPDPVLGQAPVAAVVLRAGTADPGDEALAAHARASLAGFKRPVAFVRLDVLPRTAGGKLRREVVRALVAGEPAGIVARPGGDAIGWRVTGAGPRHVLLLHGTLSTAGQLDRLAVALAARGDVTVHAIDRRGSGSSRLVRPRPLDVSIHLDDLRAYLDARGIDRADAVGVSFGGVLALELAARLPDRVRAVVAYEPPYGPVAEAGRLAWFEHLAADTERAHTRRGPAGAAETFLRAVAGNAAWDRLPERARSFLEGEGDGALADAGLTGLDPDGLRGIRCPVWILTGGGSDAFYGPIADALAARIPGARRDTLDDLAHPAAITQPGVVADAVRACLELPA